MTHEQEIIQWMIDHKQNYDDPYLLACDASSMFELWTSPSGDAIPPQWVIDEATDMLQEGYGY